MLDHPKIIEQQLWRAVLYRAVADLTKSKSIYEPDFDSAYRWVGRYPSRDFSMVCMLAGFEVDFIHPRLMRMAEVRLAEEAKPLNKKYVAAE